MHIPFDDFDKVMSKCFEVFTSWDDEYDKLQGLLRYKKVILQCLFNNQVVLIN